MESNIAENIRTFRKQKGLTQEQLAEAMGVTTGAVHKWETGLSVPELGLIMELADFFEISVDVLLGYRLNDRGIDMTIKRLTEYCNTMDRRALTEAEKALQKYPNSLKVVYTCASVYNVFAIGKDKACARRALELLERSLVLLPQNTDPSIGELSIYRRISDAYFLLEEHEKSVDILIAHNIDGVFSYDIGLSKALFLKQYDEAENYLSPALMSGLATLIDTMVGFIAVFNAKKDYGSAYDMAEWGLDCLRRIRKQDIPDSISKIEALFLVAKAETQLRMKKKKEALSTVKEASRIAGIFDGSPNFRIGNIRFVKNSDDAGLHDGLGVTAQESIEALLKNLGDDELTGLWKEVHTNGNNDNRK